MKNINKKMKDSQVISKLFSLKGKTVVLTGAAGFFGTYFANSILESGADKIYVSDINKEYLDDLISDLKKRFGQKKIEACVINQYSRSETEKYFKYIGEKGIDVLINNAFDFTLNTGFYDKEKGRVEKATYDHLQKSFESALYWPFQATQILGNISKKTKRKLSVINIGSMYSFVVPNPILYKDTGYFNPPGYSMMKTGLLAQTRYMAAWYAPQVRVNALCPGAIPNYKKSQNKDRIFTGRLTERTLLKKLGHPNDLVGTIIFLASDASSYMTGQTIIVDGGWVIT